MKIAIIGTGNVGQALGTSFVRAGHDVTFAARDAAKTRDVAARIGATAADGAAGAVAGADVVVLAVPYDAIAGVAREIQPATAGTIVIDASNPLTPDYSGLATAGGPSAAERVAGELEGARVVKAFNTLFASIQGEPTVLGSTVDALFATDDDAARDTVSELIDSMGFRPVHVGGLAAAGQLEAMAFLNIKLQVQTGGDWRSAFVLVGAPAAATRTMALAVR